MSYLYYANIKWQNNVPISENFNDIHHSITSGIDEAKYVFLEYNQLANRFSLLKENDIFVIGETGFGCGLNFLATLKLWNEIVKASAKLFFISFEKYPLKPSDLTQILSNFPELQPEADELIKQCYLPLPATHSLYFKNNVFLNLVIGDIENTLPEMNFLADAWFLNGSTPTWNESMWSNTVFQNISRLSRVGTTFAAFIASSGIRQKLGDNDFIVHKDKCFKKIEMLYGFKNSEVNNYTPTKSRLNKNKPTPWFDRYHNINQDKSVIIIGGGISGAATAYSLAKHGYKVTIYEKNRHLAMEASGNYQGILYGSFSHDYKPIQELSFSGYRYSHNLITKLLSANNSEYQQCGLIEIADNPKKLEKLQKFLATNIPDDFCYLVNHPQIKDLAGIDIALQHGVFFPYGLWLNPVTLVNKLSTHPNIKIIANSNIDDLRLNSNTQWDIVINNKIIDSANNVVLCNAHAINQFNITKKLAIRKIRGQISIIKDNLKLKTIICGKSYITPNRNDQYTIGATFNFKELHTRVTLEEHWENIANASTLINSFNDTERYKNNFSGQANIRASSYDYLPIVGPIADYNKFMNIYKKLSKDSKFWLEEPCPYYPGLFINVAHGAKGILTAPLCGEIIANYIDNSPLPCSTTLANALHPNRTYLHQLVKGATTK